MVGAYAKKGTCHYFMKEYHNAMQAYEDGLKIDPEHKECLEGKERTTVPMIKKDSDM